MKTPCRRFVATTRGSPAISASIRSINSSAPTGVPLSLSWCSLWVKSATGNLQCEPSLFPGSVRHRSRCHRGHPQLIRRLGIGHTLHLDEIEDGPLLWRKIENRLDIGRIAGRPALPRRKAELQHSADDRGCAADSRPGSRSSYGGRPADCRGRRCSLSSTLSSAPPEPDRPARCQRSPPPPRSFAEPGREPLSAPYPLSSWKIALAIEVSPCRHASRHRFMTICDTDISRLQCGGDQRHMSSSGFVDTDLHPHCMPSRHPISRYSGIGRQRATSSQ